MSDLDKAGMQIDINGNGIMDVFNPYLKVTAIFDEIQLPVKNSSNWVASHDFYVDPSNTDPIFYLDDLRSGNEFLHAFSKINETTWRITYYGQAMSVGEYIYPVWKEPLMRNAVVVVGGNRG